MSPANMIAATLQILPEDKLLRQFAQIFLESIATTSLLKLKPEDVAVFLQERYTFFQRGIKKPQFQIYCPQKKAKDKNVKCTIECIYPDASYQLVTLDTILREFNLQVTKKYHPIMTVELTKKDGSIKAIKSPAPKTNLISVIYYEIEELEDTKCLAPLEASLKSHLAAIQASFKDQEKIITQLDIIKKTIPKKGITVAETITEWKNLLDWLKNQNFTFFGYGSFTINTQSKTNKIKFNKDSGLGILSKEGLKADRSNLLSNLEYHTYQLRHMSSSFVFDTINVLSPIQRFENLMRLSLKFTDSKGIVTEHIFLGLLKRSSLFTKNIQTPLIHLKMKYIFEDKSMIPGSYNYNEVIRTFTSIPKYELFRHDKETLLKMMDDTLSIINPHDVYCFQYPLLEQRRLPVITILPTDLFTNENIEEITQYLTSRIPHTELECIEIPGEEQSRLHFYFDQPGNKDPKVDIATIEENIRELIKPWEINLKEALEKQLPTKTAKKLYHRYIHAFPDHYKGRRTTQEALEDLQILTTMEKENEVQVNLIPFVFSKSVISGKASILSIYDLEKRDLINMMPVLQSLGIHVYDEYTSRIGTIKEQIGYIHAFRVVDYNQKKIKEDVFKPIIIPLIKNIFKGLCPIDPLNQLALSAKLDWKKIHILQTYRDYYIQLEAPYSREKINNTLLNYPNIAGLLVQFFITKFSPDSSYGPKEERLKTTLKTIKHDILDQLINVHDVADDTIIKRLFNLMDITLRTNFFQAKKEEDTTISIKIDSSQARQMPKPIPYREIYVHDVNMEGIHLRFGKVARGGLRWSDRIDDFRKEVLGLVKTQQVKNVVIVPVGSKGGFVIKKPPKTRTALQKEGEKQYKIFIQGLLDITDTYNEKNKVTHPHNVVFYDEPDPYLVVAADKGTANNSDIANSISNKYKFWLGDAFASGGSVGYNHKEEGITAKGAWENVKLHFLEMGKDIQTEPFTVLGVGDMSGDVFGNGMLLSKAIKLQAAFNHLHIFIDPDPDPAKSWKERNRLFKLPRSTWRDYNEKLISKGGGIFDRNAKEIVLTPEIKALLKTKKETLNGQELIHALLKIKVELLWLGGIGTYIKAEQETAMDVGDPANDRVRINESECNATVIGEGANLGLTQLARIDFSKSGGRCNTDAIDNSAGVNMSDYEVNIKIFLKMLLKNKVIKTTKERNTLLEKATSEVTELCLKNNRNQHQLLSQDAIRSKTKNHLFAKLIYLYITNGTIDAQNENIPSQTELKNIGAMNIAIPRPVLAIIQAYVKMNVYQKLVDSSLFKDPFFDNIYDTYFPKSLLKKFKEHIHNHPLKTEILGTVITNKIINRAGMTFFYKAEQVTGQSEAEIAKAYLIADACLQGSNFRKEIYKHSKDKSQIHSALITFENILQTLTLDLLMLPGRKIEFSLIKPLKDIISQVQEHFTSKRADARSVNKWKQRSFSANMAKQLSALKGLHLATDILHFTLKGKKDTIKTLELILHIDDLLNFEWIMNKLSTIEAQNQWELSQKELLIQSIKLHRVNLLNTLLKTHPNDAHKLTQKEIESELNEALGSSLHTYSKNLIQLRSSETINLTSLSVTLSPLQLI